MGLSIVTESVTGNVPCSYEERTKRKSITVSRGAGALGLAAQGAGHGRHLPRHREPASRARRARARCETPTDSVDLWNSVVNLATTEGSTLSLETSDDRELERKGAVSWQFRTTLHRVGKSETETEIRVKNARPRVGGGARRGTRARPEARRGDMRRPLALLDGAGRGRSRVFWKATGHVCESFQLFHRPNRPGNDRVTSHFSLSRDETRRDERETVFSFGGLFSLSLVSPRLVSSARLKR